MDREAGKGHGIHDAGRGERDLGHLLDDLLGTVERGAFWQLGKADEVLLVLGWNESGGHSVETFLGGPDETDVEKDGQDTEAHDLPHDPNV